jgi:cell division protein FtsI/penicillin-binding protein 2
MRERSTGEHGALVSRGSFLVGTLLLLLALMVGRYFQLMVVRHEDFSVKSVGQLERREEVPAYRGTLFDRRGRALALTRAVTSVAVDPGRVPYEDRDPLAYALADLLGVSPKKVRAQLEVESRFRWLRRQILDEEVVDRVREFGHPAVILRKELARTHPSGSVGAALVGITTADGRGITGIERSFDAALVPCPGERVVLRDGTRSCRRISPPEGTIRAKSDGEDVTLAMDLTIQSFAAEALDRGVAEWEPESAVAVVMDPRNGDVLALADRPSFDPDERRTISSGATKIRAVSDAYEVGSTMKPLLAAAALEAGVVSYHDVFDCTTSGRYRIGRSRILKDHKPLGTLPFPGVVIHSSNIGMAQMVARLGVERTYRHVRALGFGASTRSGLPAEVKGTVRPRSKWTAVWSLPSIAMGHEITVTPIQFAAAFSALVNGGILYRPRIALRAGEDEIPPRPLRQVYTPEVSTGVMVPILERVVAEGTGRKVKIPGYRVGGKTGTAQILDRRRNVLGYTSSFVGFAPAEAPRFLVFVVMVKPTRTRGTPYGGSTAGPVVREILERCLRYAEVPPAVDAPAPRVEPSRERAPDVGPPRRSSPSRRYRDIDLLQFKMRQRGG